MKGGVLAPGMQYSGRSERPLEALCSEAILNMRKTEPHRASEQTQCRASTCHCRIESVVERILVVNEFGRPSSGPFEARDGGARDLCRAAAGDGDAARLDVVAVAAEDVVFRVAARLRALDVDEVDAAELDLAAGRVAFDAAVCVVARDDYNMSVPVWVSHLADWHLLIELPCASSILMSL